MRVLIIRPQRNAVRHTLAQPQRTRVEPRKSRGLLVAEDRNREAGGGVVVGIRAAQAAARRTRDVQARTIRSVVSGVQHHAPGQRLLQVQIPGLNIRQPVMRIDRVAALRNRCRNRGKPIGQRELSGLHCLVGLLIHKRRLIHHRLKRHGRGKGAVLANREIHAVAGPQHRLFGQPQGHTHPRRQRQMVRIDQGIR